MSSWWKLILTLYMTWLISLLPLLSFLYSFLIVLHPYISLVSSKYFCPCNCFLFSYINLIYQLAFSGLEMLINPYCFEPDIKGPLIFEQYSSHLLFCCLYLLLKQILLLLLLLCLLLPPSSWYPSPFFICLSLSSIPSMSCDITSSNLLFLSSWLEPCPCCLVFRKCIGLGK